MSCFNCWQYRHKRFKERLRIKDIREELKNTLSVKKNDVYGFIIRTNAVDFSKEDILKQADDLINQLEDLKSDLLLLLLRLRY